MPLTTVTVSIATYAITGAALPNGRLDVELTGFDINGGIVAPAGFSVSLDENGEGSFATPPSADGSRGRQLRVTLFNSAGELQMSALATVPETDCDLHSILDLEAPASVDDATQAKLDAQAAAALSKSWATKTDGEVVAGEGYGAKKYAQDAEASAGAAALSEAATGADATATAADRVQTGLDRAAAAASAAEASAAGTVAAEAVHADLQAALTAQATSLINTQTIVVQHHAFA